VQTGKGAAAAEVPGDGWIRLVRTDGAVHLDGSARATLGHRIPRPETPDDGVFASWHWDGETLRVENDRYGAYPLFYHASDEQVLVSPSLVRILELGAPRELDEDALAAFLALGFYLGQDTAFRAIRALPSGGRLTWSATGWQVAAPSRPGFRNGSLGREAAVDGVIETMRASIGRRLEGATECIIPISGGRDSRHILLELHAQGHTPRLGVTAEKYPHQSDTDPIAAAQLCAAIGMPHRTLPMPAPLVPTERVKNGLSHFAADEHAWYLRVREALAGQSHTYDGLAGGMLLRRQQATNRSRLRDLVAAGRVADVATQLVKGVDGEARYLSLLAPTMRAALAPPRAAARISRELESHLSTENPLASFYFWNRSIRELGLAPYALSGVPTVYSPFLDHDLFDFVTSIPTEHTDSGLHGLVLTRAYPRFADVPLSPRPGKAVAPSAFLRRVHRDQLAMVARSSGALLARGPLLRRALSGWLRGDDWPVHGRRAILVTYLAQLERLAATGRT
jgi:asparagine synthase (glutamine-hydrolysing)